jgi:hypothetical protein
MFDTTISESATSRKLNRIEMSSFITSSNASLYLCIMKYLVMTVQLKYCFIRYLWFIIRHCKYLKTTTSNVM